MADNNLIKQLLVQTAEGKKNAQISGTIVHAANGDTFEAHATDVTRHVTASEHDYLIKAGQAHGVALLDASGHIPSGAFDTSKMPVEVSVATIAERDALSGLPDGLKVFVEDATADATVKAGWAIYRHHTAKGEKPVGWTKIAENESLDLLLQWLNIQDKPEVLDKLSVVGGALALEGKPVGSIRMIAAVEDAPADAPEGTLFLVIGAAA